MRPGCAWREVEAVLVEEPSDSGIAARLRRGGGTATIAGDGQRIEYCWDDLLTDWCINDARGLEHGYTVQQRPAGAGLLRFTLAVRGGLQPRVQGNRDVRFADAQGATALTYSGLKVFDAAGAVLPAWFEEEADGGLELLVDEAAAVYPLTIDPIAQQAYLKASNTETYDQFGHSVSVSGDTVVVGALGEASNVTGVSGYQTNNGTVYSGAAYVFVIDSDGDGIADGSDGCPLDPAKSALGQCGCGVPDTDTDSDGTADCNDSCPNDPAKVAADRCGCGVSDTDSDGAGTPNCNDRCPNDPSKTEPGICGCGVADPDTNGDGWADCLDSAATDPAINPGTPEPPNQDRDRDRVNDDRDVCPDVSRTCPDGCPPSSIGLCPGTACGLIGPSVFGLIRTRRRPSVTLHRPR